MLSILIPTYVSRRKLVKEERLCFLFFNLNKSSSSEVTADSPFFFFGRFGGKAA
jgi:hypothetical protein